MTIAAPHSSRCFVFENPFPLELMSLFQELSPLTFFYVSFTLTTPSHSRPKRTASRDPAASFRTGGGKAFHVKTGLIRQCPLPDKRRAWIPCTPAWSSRSSASLPTSFRSTRCGALVMSEILLLSSLLVLCLLVFEESLHAGTRLSLKRKNGWETDRRYFFGNGCLGFLHKQKIVGMYSYFLSCSPATLYPALKLSSGVDKQHCFLNGACGTSQTIAKSETARICQSC